MTSLLGPRRTRPARTLYQLNYLQGASLRVEKMENRAWVVSLGFTLVGLALRPEGS